MALGTPVTGAVAYSASAGTSVSPAYPAGIGAGDVLVLFVGQKPSTANGGTVTTPTGWTLRTQLVGAGGYGTTLGADTGNTNLRVYTKDTVTGSETGNLAVTLGVNGVAWAFMVLVPTSGGAISYGDAAGSQAATPTSPMSVALTLTGTAAAAFEANDLALWAMCIPTDVTTPSQFSAESITATGATFGTAVELNEPDSATGNDIGGYSAYAFATAGTATTTPTVTTSIAGTLTNVRGPVILLRVREAPPPAQPLTQNTRFDNTNSLFGPTADNTNTVAPGTYNNANVFFAATVTPGAVDLTPVLYANDNTFYAVDVTQSGGTVDLQPPFYTNTNAFYTTTVAATYAVTPALYTNTNTFFAPAVTATRALTPTLFTNTNTFYSASAASSYALFPPIHENTNFFYGPAITTTRTLLPARYDNTNDFFGPDIAATRNLIPALYTNDNAVYAPLVEQFAAEQFLLPSLVQNFNEFFGADVSREDVLYPERLTNTNSFFGADITTAYDVAPDRYDNTSEFYDAYATTGTVIIPTVTQNVNGFFGGAVSTSQPVLPARFDNTNTFYAVTATVTRDVFPDLFTNTNRFFPTEVRAVNPVLVPLINSDNIFYPATATAIYSVRFEDYSVPGYVDPGYIGLDVQGNSFVYAPALVYPHTVAPPLLSNTNTFFSATLVVGPVDIAPPLYANDNEFFGATVYPFWPLRPSTLFSNNQVFPATLTRGFPRPDWNRDTIATSEAFAGKPNVGGSSWTPDNPTPTPNFNPDTQQNTPNWNTG